MGLLIFKIAIILIWLMKWRWKSLILQKTRSVRWQMPILKKAGLLVNRFPQLMEWGLAVIILASFFNIGTISIKTQWSIGIRIIGMLLFLIGIGLQLYSINCLGSNYASGILIRKGQTLVYHGPYRFIRHPEYAGNILAFTGLAVALFSYPALGLALLIYAPFLSYRARVEEKMLTAYFGQQYRQYRQQVGRFFPTD